MKGKPRNGVVGSRAFPYLLILPMLALEGALIVYPIIRGALFSLDTPDGLGLDNYRQMLVDPDFWRMIRNTLVFTLSVDVIILTIGLSLALLMNWSFRGRSIVRSLLTVPWAIPEVPVAITFVLMLDPSFGVFNAFLRLVPGVTESPQWLLDPVLAMVVVITVTVWKGFPFYSLVLLSALQSVPDELYEAAKIDGAGRFAQFRYITIPGIRGTLALLAVLAFIYSTQQFTLIWLITGGGPVDATTTLAPAIYMQAFRFYNFSYAGAIAVVGFLISAVATTFFVIVQRRLEVRE
ncbi:sugar ABC transporter permease [Kaistia dalseonensis]|uniref:Multiple sugar transport system permease protein n=1 Tax=Kaistia dalseonensis TaxID=410840 RepID=A0ABU0H4B6_9HYPH|nr:sugar ABC transporter permease [Kaistia dalseonensis]MCX5494052.1 sugar ABC transporter permease [Kaistia dalseonensis]MDQ0436630.1 multiple sugar transport system permease protein [Kaistia dalseonensis]